MAEYIEREAAIEYARLLYCKDCNSYNGVRCRACAFDDAMLLIEDVHAADVVEVQHGYWKIEDDPSKEYKQILVCSVCGKKIFNIENPTKAIEYRPHCYCGAKMDGKGEGE